MSFVRVGPEYQGYNRGRRGEPAQMKTRAADGGTRQLVHFIFGQDRLML